MMLEDKHKEYELMMNSQRRTIRADIPNGPSLACHDSWDYKTDLKETSFKTTTLITREHPLLKVTELDLTPVTTKKVYIVRILRQPESNLKDVPRQAKRNI